MITYVINTSENKAFDRDRGSSYHGNAGLLFDLAGYHNIRWMYTKLPDIRECADGIVEDQNKLVRDDFRIAIIVDFSSFDRVFIPYVPDDSKVQVCIYKDFLEAYLYTKLYDYVSRKGYRPKSCEVYYIQRVQDDSEVKPANYLEQACRAFSLDEEAAAHKKILNIGDLSLDAYTDEKIRLLEEMKEELAAARAVTEKKHSAFSLHLSEASSLEFPAREYAGVDETSFESFVQEIEFRKSGRSDIVFRHFNTTVGGSAAAAYDNLVFSLYLVKSYEKDTDRSTLSDSEIRDSVSHVDSRALSDHLCDAYYRVRHARDRAFSAKAKYFPLDVFKTPDTRTEAEIEEFAEPTEKKTEPVLPREYAHGKKFDEQYRTIRNLAAHEKETMSKRDKEEFGGIMKRFFHTRDENTQERVYARFRRMEEENRLTKKNIDPPREVEYDELIHQREDEMQELLQVALSAEYVGQDYSEEKAAADDANERYHSAEVGMKFHILGDLALLVFTVLVMLIPYGALQLSNAPFSLSAWLLYGISAGVFTGILLLSYFMFLGPLQQKKAQAIRDMCDCYNAALAKREKAFEKLKNRYDDELPRIEILRYEIRAIEKYRAENKTTHERINKHREMLEAVEICLRSLLNNMNVYVDSRKKIESGDDFNPEEPVKSEINTVYRVFSLEALEKLFKKGGRSDGSR